MKAAIVLVLIFTAAILFTGCGHYGMGRHYNNNWHNQTIPGPQNMDGNRMGHQGPYMNGNATQSQWTYGR
jgi:hypothetical protein